MAEHRQDLQEAASYFYEACDLFEDGDLDRDDHLAVLQRAFLTSDCDDFAWMPSRITGWPPVRIEWEISGHGRGHHTLVKTPDGSLVDVSGHTDLDALQERFGGRRRLDISLYPARPHEPLFDTDPGEGGDLGHARMLAQVIAHLPYPPYSEESVRSRARALLAEYDRAIAPEGEAALPSKP